jgi:hypothetical protein
MWTLTIILYFHRSVDLNEPKEYYAEIQRILNQMAVPHTVTTATDRAKAKSFRPHSPSPTPSGGKEEAER